MKTFFSLSPTLMSSFLVWLFLVPATGHAHKIQVFAWVSGDTVTVESGFGGKRPLMHGAVTIKDKKSGTVLLQGQSDDKGIFTFPVPQKAKDEAMDLLIVVAGGEGHQNEWLVPASEYLSEDPTTATPTAKTPAIEPAAPAPVKAPAPTVAPTGATDQELKAMLEEVVRKELAPIKRSLAKAEERAPSLQDILGGLGYLLGLAGLVAWLEKPALPDKGQIVIEEPFAEGNSLLHRRDARVKIIGACVLSLLLALTTSFPVAGTGCLVTALLLSLSRPPIRLLIKRVATVNLFVGFLWLTLPFTYGGDQLTTLFGLPLSEQGIRSAALITLKTNAILFCFLALVATSPLASLGRGMESLGLPRKLSFLLLFTYRQLFIIHQEYLRLQRAVRLRGFVPSNSLHTYRTYGHLFGMTLVKSWNRAQRIHQAMLLRGFSGRLYSLNQPPLHRDDYLFLTILLLLWLILAGLSL